MLALMPQALTEWAAQRQQMSDEAGLYSAPVIAQNVCRSNGTGMGRHNRHEALSKAHLVALCHNICNVVTLHQAWGQASNQAYSLTIPSFGWLEVR